MAMSALFELSARGAGAGNRGFHAAYTPPMATCALSGWSYRRQWWLCMLRSAARREAQVAPQTLN